jgi:hypothetical protein
MCGERANAGETVAAAERHLHHQARHDREEMLLATDEAIE